MSDMEMLDWLQADNQRLQYVYWRRENEDCSIRAAIEWLVRRWVAEQEDESSQ